MKKGQKMPPLPKDKTPLFDFFGSEHLPDIQASSWYAGTRVKPDFDNVGVILR